MILPSPDEEVPLAKCSDPSRERCCGEELQRLVRRTRLLNGGVFTSPEQMVTGIMAFIAVYNRTVRPCRWIYDVSRLAGGLTCGPL